MTRPLAAAVVAAFVLAFNAVPAAAATGDLPVSPVSAQATTPDSPVATPPPAPKPPRPSDPGGPGRTPHGWTDPLCRIMPWFCRS